MYYTIILIFYKATLNRHYEIISTFFIADTYFNHSKIIKYCNRPFISSEEQTNKLIENWNSVVKDNDTVFVLGDFSFL